MMRVSFMDTAKAVLLALVVLALACVIVGASVLAGMLGGWMAWETFGEGAAKPTGITIMTVCCVVGLIQLARWLDEMVDSGDQ